MKTTCSASYTNIDEYVDVEIVDVSSLSPPEFNTRMIEQLVLSDKRIDLIKALSSNFTKPDSGSQPVNMQRWTADFVKGKGNSQIFLLYVCSRLYRTTLISVTGMDHPASAKRSPPSALRITQEGHS